MNVYLRDDVFLNENLMDQLLEHLALPAVLALRGCARDLLVAVMCSRPTLYESLMQNKQRVLAHRQWFEFARKQLRELEVARERSMQRCLEDAKYEAGQDDERESRLRGLQRKWWGERRGWTTERTIVEAERGLVRQVIESAARLGTLADLV
jgi:hypothetical protein